VATVIPHLKVVFEMCEVEKLLMPLKAGFVLSCVM